ncbi:uncharacterized protein AC631_02424 [Debaryomyces fabryi]|uniref:Rho-GAP domain-containing protein n=1 Tax=Debaryomyces fabryi TaxID=58627 RepID=A0A0V1PZW4_9ASCO|nr:uncharacterized protein AC631_02424 [Debaryomyces fabryi]KSA01816.1 hypothetical protein AC631_02424 [Debaryomyces fabryi]CUM46742.1 unnamed protein product [Debaryomyces fabryi]
MSHSLSPTNRNSIFGWVKNLKRGSLMSSDSVNDVTSDNDAFPGESRSPTKSINNGQTQVQSPHSHQEFLRPMLHHKSRSTNNLNRVRSNSFNQSEKSSTIRQHRDSFLQHNPLVDENSKYFGVPLDEAIKQASAKISILTNEDSDHVLQYGKIPIVVAKCGVYLKKNGLNVEGIFRVGGSSKRVKELQLIFNSPPDFGKKLNWDGYTVHDAASVLRRYLNALPEPLITLDLYESFREPLRKRQRIIHYMKYKAENPNKPYKKSNTDLSLNDDDKKIDTNSELLSSSHSQPLTETNIGRLNNSNLSTSQDTLEIWNSKNASQNASLSQSNPRSNSQAQADLIQTSSKSNNDSKSKAKKLKNYTKLTKDIHEAIDEYKAMVDNLPNLSKQLLFYILDLLAMVQNNASENLMPSRNLAAIFQPSILSHPSHDMDPVEYALSQLVVEFLIQYAYILLPNQNPSKLGSKSKQVSSTSLDKTGQPDCESNRSQVASLGQHEQQQERNKFSQQSDATTNNLTSTSTTPLDFESQGLLNKPFKRYHSKSLSSSSNHEDLVGYQNNVNSKSLPIVDSDHDFEITDDENDDETPEVDMKDSVISPDEFQFVTNANQAFEENITPNVSIVVSTPPVPVSNTKVE